MELSGGILLKLREGLDLTRAQIAERIEGSAEAWYRWEKGLSRPSKFYRQQLRKTFGKELRALGVDIPFYESTTGDDDTGERPVQAPLQAHSVGSDSQVEASHHASEQSHASSTLFSSEDPIAIVQPSEIDMVQTFIASHMITALWNLAHQKITTTHEIRTIIRQAIEDFDAMNTANQNYHINRREALCALAALPATTLRLITPDNTVPSARYGDALMHCAAALEACWQLYRSSEASDTLLAFQCVSKYIPLLKTIAHDEAKYRGEALDLAAHYALLKTFLAWDCTEIAETISCANDAVVLSNVTGDISLRLSSYNELAWSYFYDNKHALARVAMRKGEAVLEEYQKTPGMPPVPSSVIGRFYSGYALVQTKSGENADTALGIATSSGTNNEPVAFMEFTRSTQLLEAALVCCYKGDYAEAIKWIGKRIDTDTLEPLIPQHTKRGQIEAINILTHALLKSGKRDKEQIIHHWTAGIEGARALKHERRFQEAVTNFGVMEAAFPGHKDIADLRDLTIHWEVKS